MRRLVLQLLLLSLSCVVVLGACDASGVDDSAPDVEELRPKAAEITDLLIAHDWKAVRSRFDDTMSKGLAEDGLANGWDEVVEDKGAFVSRGEPTQVPKPGDIAVFDTPLTFEQGEMKSRVSLHADGRIAGLFLLEPDEN